MNGLIKFSDIWEIFGEGLSNQRVTKYFVQVFLIIAVIEIFAVASDHEYAQDMNGLTFSLNKS